MTNQTSEKMKVYKHWAKRVPLMDIGVGHKSCVLVAGTARSGTTWLGNVIARATRSRQIFEPFLQQETFDFAIHSMRRPIFDHYQPYVPATAEPGTWQAEIDRILQGQIRHWWCDRFNPTAVYRRRVIKAVRINLMLDYLALRRPHLKIVFLVRNPLSVVNSQIAKIKQGWVLQWNADYVLSQPRLMADWLSPYRDLIEASADSDLTYRQALKWCIENIVPLARLPHRKNALIVHYDCLVRDPRQWSVIADFLADRHWSSRRFEHEVNRVSLTAERTPEQITSQTEDLNQLDRIAQQSVERVVRRFGLGRFLLSEEPRRRAA
jgi:hypothetical protein